MNLLKELINNDYIFEKVKDKEQEITDKDLISLISCSYCHNISQKIVSFEKVLQYDIILDKNIKSKIIQYIEYYNKIKNEMIKNNGNRFIYILKIYNPDSDDYPEDLCPELFTKIFSNYNSAYKSGKSIGKFTENVNIEFLIEKYNIERYPLVIDNIDDNYDTPVFKSVFSKDGELKQIVKVGDKNIILDSDKTYIKFNNGKRWPCFYER